MQSLNFLNGAKNRSLILFYLQLLQSTVFDTFFWPFAKYARLMNFFSDVLNDFHRVYDRINNYNGFWCRQILFPYKNFNFTKNLTFWTKRKNPSPKYLYYEMTWLELLLEQRERWLLKKKNSSLALCLVLFLSVFSHRSYGFRFMGISNTFNGNESTYYIL